MKNLYETDPYADQITAAILSKKITGKTGWLELDKNLVHPKGGGQPMDKGAVLFGDVAIPIKGFQREKGVSFMLVDLKNDGAKNLFEQSQPGCEVTCKIDPAYRLGAMRLHTGAHLVMAVIKSKVANYVPKGMDIDDELHGVVLRFEADDFVCPIEEIECQANGLIERGSAVTTYYYSSLDEAQKEKPEFFRCSPELSIKGDVRMVLIDGIDFNPCGGTHVKNIKEIGSVRLQFIGKNDNGDYEVNVSLADTP
jgi:Ser-tRNA(Ala) deacylase AlaX